MDEAAFTHGPSVLSKGVKGILENSNCGMLCAAYGSSGAYRAVLSIPWGTGSAVYG